MRVFAYEERDATALPCASRRVRAGSGIWAGTTPDVGVRVGHRVCPNAPGLSEEAHCLDVPAIAVSRRARGPMNLHRLDFTSLSLFTLVVRTGSISKGAEFGVDLFSLSKVMVGNRALA